MKNRKMVVIREFIFYFPSDLRNRNEESESQYKMHPSCFYRKANNEHLRKFKFSLVHQSPYELSLCQGSQSTRSNMVEVFSAYKMTVKIN